MGWRVWRGRAGRCRTGRPNWRGGLGPVAETTSIVSGVARRYASALFEVALEAGAADAVGSDLDTFDKALGESADLDEVLGRTVRLLSQLTNQVALAQYPSFGTARVRHVELVALADVGRDGDDLRIVVIFLQPGNDDGRIETARVGQNDFLDLALIHD